MSAALTACLKDFEKIRKLPAMDGTMQNLTRILQTPAHISNDIDHEMWENWTNDRLKTRTINLATIKAVLQRQQRYHVHDLPMCNDCQSLHQAEEGWQSVDELDFGRGKVEDTGRYQEVICRGIVAVRARIRFAPRRLVGGVRKTRPRSSLRGTKQLRMQ